VPWIDGAASADMVHSFLTGENRTRLAGNGLAGSTKPIAELVLDGRRAATTRLNMGDTGP